MAPAQSQSALEAKNNKKPHFKVLTTTPGNLSSPHGKYAKDMIDSAAEFDEHMYDWSKDELDNFLDKNSDNDFIYIRFTYKQLGRSEKWFREQCRNLNNDIEKINREILIQWAKSTDNSPFAADRIDRLHQHKADVIATLPILNNSYILNIYKDFDWNSKILIGGDFGGAETRDGSALSICESDSLQVAADFNNNKADAVDMANIVLELMTKYLPNSVFIPERNSYGKAVIDILLRTSVANRIYYEYKEEMAETKLTDGHVKKERIRVKKYGVHTDSQTRPLMMDILMDMVENDYKNILSPRVIEDITTLERKKNGKIEHADTKIAGKSAHDDNLFSYLMVRYIWNYGKNLSRFLIYKKSKDNNMVDGTKSYNKTELEQNLSNVFFQNKNLSQAIIHKSVGSNLMNEVLLDYYSQQKREMDRQLEENASQSRSVLNIFNLNKM